MPTPDVEDDYSTRVSPSDAVAAATNAAAQAAEGEVDGQPLRFVVTPPHQDQAPALGPVTPTTPYAHPARGGGSAAHLLRPQLTSASSGTVDSHQGPPVASDHAVVLPPSFIAGEGSMHRMVASAGVAPGVVSSSDGSGDSSRPLLPPVEPRGLTASQRDALANT